MHPERTITSLSLIKTHSPTRGEALIFNECGNSVGLGGRGVGGYSVFVKVITYCFNEKERMAGDVEEEMGERKNFNNVGSRGESFEYVCYVCLRLCDCVLQYLVCLLLSIAVAFS